MARVSSLAISTNASALAAMLGDVAGKQVPFATALALTDVAFRVQRAEKAELAQSLDLRNRFSASGLQVNAAMRSDWPETYAEVGIEARRSYLIDHIVGGKRQGGAHGRAILEDEALRSKSGRVPAGKRPAALIAASQRAQGRRTVGRTRKDKRLPFLLHSRRWNGEVLARRAGAQRDALQILYAFKRGVTIRRRFEMDVVASREVAASYPAAFDKALRKAIQTGKRE